MLVNIPHPDDQRKFETVIEIHEWDTWNIDITLAPIILPMLKQLKETKHGAPNVDWEDVPRKLRPSKEELSLYNREGTTDRKFFKRWDWVLDEMIFAFDSKVNDDWEDQFSSGEIDHISVPVDKDGNEVPEESAEFFEIRKGPNHTYEVDWEGYKAYQKRISNGFRLFGKYFESLWD